MKKHKQLKDKKYRKMLTFSKIDYIINNVDEIIFDNSNDTKRDKHIKFEQKIDVLAFEIIKEIILFTQELKTAVNFENMQTFTFVDAKQSKKDLKRNINKMCKTAEKFETLIK